jgi:pantothenate synthetase
MRIFKDLNEFIDKKQNLNLFKNQGMVLSRGVFHLGLAAVLQRMVSECDYRSLVVVSDDLSDSFIESLVPFNLDSVILIAEVSSPISFELKPKLNLFQENIASFYMQIFNVVKPKQFFIGQIDFVNAKLLSELIMDFMYDVTLNVVENSRNEFGNLYSANLNKLNPVNQTQVVALNRSLDFVQRMVSNGQKEVPKLEKLVVEFVTTFKGFKLDKIEFLDAVNLNLVNFIDPDKQILIQISGEVQGMHFSDNLLLA